MCAIILLPQHLIDNFIVWVYTWKTFPKDKRENYENPGMLAHASNPSTEEMEVEDWELKASFSYIMTSKIACAT